MTATRQERWLACREKSCCSYYSVLPTAADLWRISHSLELPVWAFTRFADAVEGTAPFALDERGPRFEIVLARRREQEPAPCVFLLRLGDGHGQCALGPARPRACSTYPLVRGADGARVGAHDGCTCGSWDDPELAAGSGELDALEQERAEHAELVEGWNALVAADPRERVFPEFCEHLLNGYARRH